MHPAGRICKLPPMTVLTSASHAKVTPRTARPEIKREHPLPLSSIHPHPPPALRPFPPACLPACLSLPGEKRGKGRNPRTPCDLRRDGPSRRCRSSLAFQLSDPSRSAFEIISARAEMPRATAANEEAPPHSSPALLAAGFFLHRDIALNCVKPFTRPCLYGGLIALGRFAHFHMRRAPRRHYFKG